MSKDLKDEIQKLIEANIPIINFYCYKNRDKPKTDGEYNTSKELLDSINNVDIRAGENKYLYNFKDLNISDKFYSLVEELFPEYKPLVSGHFYYPEGGYMSWHTNSDKPGKRVYISYVDTPNKSYFRSFVNGEVITDWDDEKLKIRVFDVVNTKPYYWHCVYSGCNRYSFGFRLLEK
jgi:hypothetical protein